MKKVLILCTGNSCRSQMAEGLINHLIGDQWQAFSAGTRPAGYVNPLAIAALDEISIDISQQQSQSVNVYQDMAFDAVITVCDNAAEDCPVWLGSGDTVRHIPFPDPFDATGSHEEQLVVYCQVRDDIRREVLGYLDKI